MAFEPEDKLRAAGAGEIYNESTWRLIVNALLDDLGRFLRTDFERDADVFVDASSSQFSIWIWSKDGSGSPLSLSWSAVLAGNPVADDSFAVTLDVFLFHELGRKRLYSGDGRHFLQFAYSFGNPEDKGWRFLGWQQDEWGEWNNVVFPEPEP